MSKGTYNYLVQQDPLRTQLQVQKPMIVHDTYLLRFKLKSLQYSEIYFQTDQRKQNYQQSIKDKINNIQGMIEIDKINLQIGQKLFSNLTKKYIRIQTQPSKVIKTKDIAKPISQTNLQWSETISLPCILNFEMPFQIFQKHQFGYNPEQFNSIMHGKIILDERSQIFYNWQVYDIRDKKIGYLSVNVKSKPEEYIVNQKIADKSIVSTNIKKKKFIDQTQLVVISSIIVNLPSIKTKRAYACVTVGNSSIKTLPVKSKSGELVFIEKYQLQKNSQTEEATIDIFSCGQDQPDVKIATSKIKLQKKINIKLKFYEIEDQTKQIGQGFIDGKVQLKSEVMSDRIFASIIRKGIQNQFSTTQRNQSTFNPLSRSIVMNNKSFSITNNPSISPFTSSKKFSVVNHNSNIKIPQQKRFFTSRDPPNNKCSYLPQQSFEFKQRKIDKYYRGASIGYGDKADFTKARKQIPSVGKYHLPSIWDRY